MRDLIVRVAVTDDDAATALRVIAHFDSLINSGAPTGAILRAAAALADAAVGLRDSAGATTRVDPDGRILLGPPPPILSTRIIDRSHGIRVWLERVGPAGPLDQLILERCTQALRVRVRPAQARRTPEHHTRTACDPNATDDERVEALRALSLTEPLTVICTPEDSAPETVTRAQLPGGWIALLPMQLPPEAALPNPSRCGSSLATDGDILRALLNASRALHLAVHPALGGPSFVKHEELGGLRTIADAISPAEASATDDVATLEAMRSRRPWVPATFYCLTIGHSLRHTAHSLHVHHSTMKDRVDWLDDAIGYSIRSEQGRTRAAAAWVLWRISGHLHSPRSRKSSIND